MSFYENPYIILNVPINSEFKDVKRSYHKLCLIYHPDKNFGDNDKTRYYILIKDAYDILNKQLNKTPYVHLDCDVDAHAVLGVTKGSSNDNIEEVYEILFLKYCSNKNTCHESDKVFYNMIKKAYDVLAKQSSKNTSNKNYEEKVKQEKAKRDREKKVKQEKAKRDREKKAMQEEAKRDCEKKAMQEKAKRDHEKKAMQEEAKRDREKKAMHEEWIRKEHARLQKKEYDDKKKKEALLKKFQNERIQREHNEKVKIDELEKELKGVEFDYKNRKRYQ